MNLGYRSLFCHFIHFKIYNIDEELSFPNCEKYMTKVSHVLLS